MENSDLDNQCCVKLIIELNNVTSELKSAMKIIEIVKEALGVTDKMVRNDKSNFDYHNGILLLTPNNENWIRVNANQKKKNVDSLRGYPSTSLSIANCFEVLYNPKNETAQIESVTKLSLK
jgi:hypothetical protein